MANHQEKAEVAGYISLLFSISGIATLAAGTMLAYNTVHPNTDWSFLGTDTVFGKLNTSGVTLVGIGLAILTASFFYSLYHELNLNTVEKPKENETTEPHPFSISS